MRPLCDCWIRPARDRCAASAGYQYRCTPHTSQQTNKHKTNDPHEPSLESLSDLNTLFMESCGISGVESTEQRVPQKGTMSLPMRLPVIQAEPSHTTQLRDGLRGRDIVPFPGF